ncbi:ABC transporter permease [Diplocloster hominis]|uniref:ABC transporter permease n=1 Tax=Diplocloster hominis TaxID=3079010 RepID=UPI0031BA45FD
MENSQSRKGKVLRGKFVDLFCSYGLWIIFIILLAYFAIQSPKFLTLSNAVNVLRLSSTLGVAVVGMFFVLITGGIDISVSANMYFSAVVGTTLLNNLGVPLPLCFAGACISGLLIGSINGFFVAKLKMVPFITTLATYSVARGLGLMFTNQQMLFLDSVVMKFSGAKLFGIPLIVYMFLIVVLLGHFILTRTQYGRQLFACGNNLAGANKLGINGTKTVFIAYLICGGLAGIAGMMNACILSVINPNFAINDEFVVISSAVIGGASLFGGKGKILPGAIIGIVMVQVITNGLTITGASAYAFTIFRGIIIFIAVMMDSIKFSGEIR